MISARLKASALFFVGLVATATVIGMAVTEARTSAAYHDASDAALANAQLALRLIDDIRVGPQSLLISDLLGRRVLAPPVRLQLQDVPGYLIVLDPGDTVQFISTPVRMLSNADRTTVLRSLNDLRSDGLAGVINLSDRRVLFVSVPVGDTTSGLKRVVSGVPVTQTTGWPAELSVTMFIIVPLIVIAATWGVWLVLGGTFKRIDRIRREVADITDGRSLHRRLSTDDVPPELAPLIATVNAMIVRLENSFMALRRFTADASHELKTPLAVLRVDVERAMHERTNVGERMIALEEALQETTRMANLVESLLTLARADEGRFDLRHEPVELGALVREVYETATILGEAANVFVSLPFTAEVVVMGDRARLRQLFLNLVTNAIKYTPPGGRVDIGLGRHPDTATFAVRDTGVGIAAADLPHIFERFWRADRVRTRTSERGGFGLGLAISQWIAQAHGGSLTVSSRLGKGSLFTVTLPLPPSEFMNS